MDELILSINKIMKTSNKHCVFHADTFKNTILEKYVVCISYDSGWISTPDNPYVLVIKYFKPYNILDRELLLCEGYHYASQHYSVIECINKIKDYLDTNKYTIDCHDKICPVVAGKDLQTNAIRKAFNLEQI